ncbi:MAG: amidohydrolase family protein [Saprospiraceae bacterium]|nr:amidohydrolase family protein [Lewinella sp.]
MRDRYFKLLLYCCIYSLCFSTGNAQDIQKVYIKAGKLFDSQQGQMITDQIIQLSGNRITGVGSDIEIPQGADVIDLSGYTVLPGLIDAHVHLLYLESPKSNLALEGVRTVIMEGDALRALRGAARAKTFLEAGITTVKDLGNSGQFLDVALKTAINEGTTPGPRMFVSGPILSSEGGQFPGLQFDHRHIAEEEYRVIRGKDDAINAVRENITYGADIIKICANNTPNNTSLTIDEMKEIVKMAHRYRRKVTAHATNNLAVWEAVVAGVDGIEHGYQVADSTLALMAEKGVPLIPTDISRTLLLKYFDLTGFEGDREQAMAGYQSSLHSRLQRAVAHGVQIVAGSDMYIDMEMPQGEGAKQVLVAYFEAGMKPIDILQSATYHSAKFMEKEQSLGVIREGAFADIIAVKGDIETDFPETIFNVVFVMKDGKKYVEKY